MPANPAPAGHPGWSRWSGPHGVPYDAGLVLVPGVVRVREGQAWLADWRGTRGVLRCSPVPEPDMAGLAEDVEWLHSFLDRLAGTGFPAPRPLLAFGGKSWTIVGGHLWEIVSFISGSVVGW